MNEFLETLIRGIDVEVFKYVLGSIPGGIAIIHLYLKRGKAETIKDYKKFLIELERAHEKLMEGKGEILRLTFEVEKLTELNNNLQKLIKEYEKADKREDEK